MRALPILAFAALTLGVVPAEAQLLKLLSPGGMIRSHDFIDECGACHQTVKQVSDGKCLDCHKVIDRQLRKRTGTHYARRKEPCVACHQDHKGRDFQSITFEPRNFDHKPTGFVLDGRHVGLTCEKCHKRPRTFRGLRSACGSCHDGKHEGKLGNDCVGCHSTQKNWKPIRSKDDHKLSMKGSHATLDCVKCHAGGEHLEPDNTCKTCHKDPHQAEGRTCTICHKPTEWKEVTFDHDTCAMGLTGKHKTVECINCHVKWQFGGIPENCKGCHTKRPKHGNLGECGRCHDTTSFRKNTFKHSKSKFPLTGKHQSVDCRHCHKTGKFNDLKGKGRGEACLDCHVDVPKHGDFGNCSPCHDTTNAVSFDHGGEDRPTTMPVRPIKKGSTASVVVKTFPLQGSHIAVSCKGCHKGVAKLGAAVQDCAMCHRADDPHDGQFGDRTSACADCHREQSFSPSTVTVKGHAPGKFPLTGKHVEVDCRRCHDRGRFTGLPMDCQGCHLDRHAGRLGEDCKACHETALAEGWPAAADTFGPKHDELLTFSLKGAHAEIACADCHKKGAQFSQATAKICTTCHNDVHGGAFGEECSDCHRTTTKDWHDREPFDHRVQATFALVASHSNLPCGDCHVPAAAGSEGVAVQLDSACSECHADPHGGAASIDCEQCHAPHGWGLTTFNHNITGWPLRGRHRIAACSSCHANNSFTGLTTVCADCHASQRPGSHAKTTWDCGDCHKPTVWLQADHGPHKTGDCTSCHDRQLAAGHRFEADECSDCHRPPRWTPIFFSHTRDAGWALRGAHAALSAPGNCGSCHWGVGQPSSGQCSECHAEGSDHFWISDNCAGCHQPTSFTHVSKVGGYLSQAHPGFGADRSGLRGVHAIADCTSCHRAEGMTMGGSGATCSSCHSAPVGTSPNHGPAWWECHSCHEPFPGWPAKRGWRANMP